jgi:mannose-6-phosphate isomerase-like protein (cupin superfamily)
MGGAAPASFRLLDTFVHLGPDGSVVPLPVTESFWADLTGGAFAHLGPGRLVSFYTFAADWDSWEIHPHGDELVCLFSGAMDFELEAPAGRRVVELREPGSFLVVPRSTWHTARVLEPSRALFVTAGQGTRHRPVQEAS